MSPSGAFQTLRKSPRQTQRSQETKGANGSKPSGNASAKVAKILAMAMLSPAVAVAEAGGCIGEISLVRSMPRSCDARTLEATEVLVIDRDRFLQILKQDTELGSKLSWYLLKRMSRLVGEGLPPVLPETLAPVLQG